MKPWGLLSRIAKTRVNKKYNAYHKVLLQEMGKLSRIRCSDCSGFGHHAKVKGGCGTSKKIKVLAGQRGGNMSLIINAARQHLSSKPSYGGQIEGKGVNLVPD